MELKFDNEKGCFSLIVYSFFSCHHGCLEIKGENRLLNPSIFMLITIPIINAFVLFSNFCDHLLPRELFFIQVLNNRIDDLIGSLNLMIVLKYKMDGIKSATYEEMMSEFFRMLFLHDKAMLMDVDLHNKLVIG